MVCASAPPAAGEAYEQGKQEGAAATEAGKEKLFGAAGAGGLPPQLRPNHSTAVASAPRYRLPVASRLPLAFGC